MDSLNETARDLSRNRNRPIDKRKPFKRTPS